MTPETSFCIFGLYIYNMLRNLLVAIVCLLTSFSGDCCQNRVYAALASKVVITNTDKEEVKIYPNPSTSFFSLSQSKAVGEILVFNILGQTVKKFEVNDANRYFVGDLIKGSYIVQIRDHKESVISSLRMKKE